MHGGTALAVSPLGLPVTTGLGRAITRPLRDRSRHIARRRDDRPRHGAGIARRTGLSRRGTRRRRHSRAARSPASPSQVRDRSAAPPTASCCPCTTPRSLRLRRGHAPASTGACPWHSITSISRRPGGRPAAQPCVHRPAPTPPSHPALCLLHGTRRTDRVSCIAVYHHIPPGIAGSVGARPDSGGWASREDHPCGAGSADRRRCAAPHVATAGWTTPARRGFFRRWTDASPVDTSPRRRRVGSVLASGGACAHGTRRVDSPAGCRPVVAWLVARWPEGPHLMPARPITPFSHSRVRTRGDCAALGRNCAATMSAGRMHSMRRGPQGVRRTVGTLARCSLPIRRTQQPGLGA